MSLKKKQAIEKRREAMKQKQEAMKQKREAMKRREAMKIYTGEDGKPYIDAIALVNAIKCGDDLPNFPEGLVVKGDVNLRHMGLEKLPDLSKVIIDGTFDCSYNKLTDLKGAPKEVRGSFGCIYNKLTRLKGAPQKIGGWFNCSYNNLPDLTGAPQEVGAMFICLYNEKLTSLYGAPQEVGLDFLCDKKIADEYGLDYSDYHIFKKLKESPRYIAETKAKEVRRKVMREIAAENVSPQKGKVNRKYSDEDKKIIKAILDEVSDFKQYIK